MNWFFPSPVIPERFEPRLEKFSGDNDEWIGEKRCSRCKATKPMDEFSWKKEPRLSAGGRYAAQCKECNARKAYLRKIAKAATEARACAVIS